MNPKFESLLLLVSLSFCAGSLSLRAGEVDLDLIEARVAHCKVATPALNAKVASLKMEIEKLQRETAHDPSPALELAERYLKSVKELYQRAVVATLKLRKEVASETGFDAYQIALKTFNQMLPKHNAEFMHSKETAKFLVSHPEAAKMPLISQAKDDNDVISRISGFSVSYEWTGLLSYFHEFTTERSKDPWSEKSYLSAIFHRSKEGEEDSAVIGVVSDPEAIKFAKQTVDKVKVLANKRKELKANETARCDIAKRMYVSSISAAEDIFGKSDGRDVYYNLKSGVYEREEVQARGVK